MVCAMKQTNIFIKFGYGVGQAASSGKDLAFHYYFILFFSATLGLPASLVGLAKLIALVVDALTDPLMGRISDTYYSKIWGRRHLFMLMGGPLIGLFLYLLFNPPMDLGTWSLFAWMLGFAILVRTAITIFYVPYLSLGAELSDDYDERTEIASIRNFFGYATALIVSTFVLLVFLHDTPEYPNGLLNPAGYGKMGVLVAGIAVLATIIATFSTKRTIVHLPRPPSIESRPSWWMAYWDMLCALRLRSFGLLWAALTASAIVAGMSSALSLYMATYFWGMSSQQTFLFVAGYMIALVPASLLGPWLVRRYDKRSAVLLSIALSVVLGIFPLLLRFGGLAPENGTVALMTLVVSFSVLSEVFKICALIIAFAMVADVTDEYALHIGRREEGVIFAAVSFGQKMTFGVGGFLAGVGLDLIRFPTQIGAEQVAPETIMGLGILAGPAVVLLTIPSFMLYWHYRVGRQQQAHIRNQLIARGIAVSSR